MLTDKKVFVGKFSKEIREKASKLGWETILSNNLEIYPFLYFNDQKEIYYGNDLQEFNNHSYEEVSPEWILSLEEPKKKKTWKEFGEVNGYIVDGFGRVKKGF